MQVFKKCSSGIKFIVTVTFTFKIDFQIIQDNLTLYTSTRICIFPLKECSA